MAKLSDFFKTQHGHEKRRNEICANCKYIQRPFGDKPFQGDYSQSVYCEKHLKYIEMINSNSCCYFEFFNY